VPQRALAISEARGNFPNEFAALKMSLLGDQITGPDRHRPGTMDHAMEARAQRVRDHLRRPIQAAETY
jgi:hypothetical protein